MKKVRQNVFETNSSSTHSICIAKNMELIIPSEIHFGFGEFGWEEDTLNSCTEKASYLYTGLFANDRYDDAMNLFSVLESKGIKVTHEEPIYGKDSSYAKNGGYVDHSGELGSFLNAVCGDENALMSYLFSPLSFVVTGNDNSDCDADTNVSYEHDEYYKGN